jgi:hypothetical protein
VDWLASNRPSAQIWMEQREKVHQELETMGEHLTLCWWEAEPCRGGGEVHIRGMVVSVVDGLI